MRQTFFLILLLFFYTLDHLSGQSDFIDERTGTEIHFTVSENIFPDYWNSWKINARAVELSPTEYSRVQKIITRALVKYPVHVVKENLKRIYVFNNLNFYSLPYGGTSSVSKKAVYIAEDTALHEQDLYIETIFHHEFSSLLFKKFPYYLNEKEWNAINPPGFHYGKGGLEAIRSGNSSMSYDSILVERGFLNKYSQSSLEEDMNVIAQSLFCGGDNFREIMAKNEKIKAKVLLIIDFYQKLDPVFTEEYFRNL
jgi:hypothetical protein